MDAAGNAIGGAIDALPGPNPLDALGSVGRFAQALTSRDTLFRVAKVVAGLALVALGLIVVFRDSITIAAAGAAGGPLGAAVASEA